MGNIGTELIASAIGERAEAASSLIECLALGRRHLDSDGHRSGVRGYHRPPSRQSWRTVGSIASVCKLSFSPDTQVATPNSEQAIGTLQVGDVVTAYDPQTGQTSTQQIEHVWINHDSDVVDVTLRTVAAPPSRVPQPALPRCARLS